MLPIQFMKYIITEYSEQLEQKMKEQENQLATQSADTQVYKVTIAMWEERCNDLGKQLDSSEEDRKMYTDIQKEIDKLRAQNSSLEISIQSALQTIREKEEVLDRYEQDRNMSEIRYRDLQNEKEAIISRLNQDILDIQSKSEEAVMQWKG